MLIATIADGGGNAAMLAHIGFDFIVKVNRAHAGHHEGRNVIQRRGGQPASGAHAGKGGIIMDDYRGIFRRFVKIAGFLKGHAAKLGGKRAEGKSLVQRQQEKGMSR